MPSLRSVLKCLAIFAALAIPAEARPARDTSLPMQSLPEYSRARLVGQWYEVARSASVLEQDCHAVPAEVATRDDSRLNLKIACHKGSASGPVLPIDGILVDEAPGVFSLRFVRQQQYPMLLLVVLWQAEDDSLAVIGAPGGEVGWVWSKSPKVDPDVLAQGIETLIAAGYRAKGIRPAEDWN